MQKGTTFRKVGDVMGRKCLRNAASGYALKQCLQPGLITSMKENKKLNQHTQINLANLFDFTCVSKELKVDYIINKKNKQAIVALFNSPLIFK